MVVLVRFGFDHGRHPNLFHHHVLIVEQQDEHPTRQDQSKPNPLSMMTNRCQFLPPPWASATHSRRKNTGLGSRFVKPRLHRITTGNGYTGETKIAAPGPVEY